MASETEFESEASSEFGSLPDSISICEENFSKRARHSRHGDAQYYADCQYRAGVVSIQEFAAWPVRDLELLETQSRLGKFWCLD